MLKFSFYVVFCFWRVGQFLSFAWKGDFGDFLFPDCDFCNKRVFNFFFSFNDLSIAGKGKARLGTARSTSSSRLSIFPKKNEIAET